MLPRLRRIPWFGSDRRGRPRRAQRFRLVRDVVGSVIILGVVLGGLFVASNGAWPPVLVVESGSMMHDQDATPYGRLGTIDVGDMIFVRATNDPLHDVHTWAEGGASHYGRPGDVIVYARNGDMANVSIIHRAITYVDVHRARNLDISYTLQWTDHQTLVFNRSGIYLPALGFDERNGFTPTDGYRPAYSGFITKGDNAISNAYADQAVANFSAIVDPSWVVGTAHGEIPWMGLGKLAIQSGKTNPEVPGWARVGNAFAPVELWSMFFLCLGLLILVPLTVDTIRLYGRHRRRIRDEKRARADNERRKAARRVIEFEPVTR